MPHLIAKKIQMSQIFGEDGAVMPVTVLRVLPNIVTFVKTKEKDGYESVQIGFGERKTKNIKKPQAGHLKASGASPMILREFKTGEVMQVGDKIDASVFSEGDNVTASGIVKGRGFQGVVKRHGFHGGPRTHGQKHSEREPGSIGSVWPQRVLKGKRMAGRMGGNKITLKNLKIVKIDAADNLIYVKGALPGGRGSLIEIKSAK
ncbi:50S ribosomal protein L3 [Candidatus Giovannonibacteria bacterium]|nr:50S ribosomal protein L3 [Candidatus Giovannonibacteria bacterium]